MTIISMSVSAALRCLGALKNRTELEIVETPESATAPAEKDRESSSTRNTPSRLACGVSGVSVYPADSARAKVPVNACSSPYTRVIPKRARKM